MPGPKAKALSPLDARAAYLYDVYKDIAAMQGATPCGWFALPDEHKTRWREVARYAFRYVKDELG